MASYVIFNELSFHVLWLFSWNISDATKYVIVSGSNVRTFLFNHLILCRILCWFQICNRFFSTTKTKLPMWPFTIERFLRLWAKSVIFRYFQGVSNIVNMHIKLKEMEFWYHWTLNKGHPMKFVKLLWFHMGFWLVKFPHVTSIFVK